MAHQGADINSQVRPDVVQPLGEGLPLLEGYPGVEALGADVLDASEHANDPPRHLLVLARGHADGAIPTHDRGHPVPRRRVEAAVPGEVWVEVGVAIDEPGGKNLALPVHLLL